MPHVIVKLIVGRTPQQKAKLSEAIVGEVTQILGLGEESVSISFEEINSENWREQVYLPDIIAKEATLTKKPGYRM